MTRTQCYNKLYKLKILELEQLDNITKDKMSRLANKYAVKNTNSFYDKVYFLRTKVIQFFNSDNFKPITHYNRFGMPDLSAEAKINRNIKVVKLKNDEVYFCSINNLSIAFDENDFQGDIDEFYAKLKSFK